MKAKFLKPGLSVAPKSAIGDLAAGCAKQKKTKKAIKQWKGYRARGINEERLMDGLAPKEQLLVAVTQVLEAMMDSLDVYRVFQFGTKQFSYLTEAYATAKGVDLEAFRSHILNAIYNQIQVKKN